MLPETTHSLNGDEWAPGHCLTWFSYPLDRVFCEHFQHATKSSPPPATLCCGGVFPFFGLIEFVNVYTLEAQTTAPICKYAELGVCHRLCDRKPGTRGYPTWASKLFYIYMTWIMITLLVIYSSLCGTSMAFRQTHTSTVGLANIPGNASLRWRLLET